MKKIKIGKKVCIKKGLYKGSVGVVTENCIKGKSFVFILNHPNNDLSNTMPIINNEYLK